VVPDTYLGKWLLYGGLATMVLVVVQLLTGGRTPLL
jgi:hypothetical protein